MKLTLGRQLTIGIMEAVQTSLQFSSVIVHPIFRLTDRCAKHCEHEHMLLLLLAHAPVKTLQEIHQVHLCSGRGLTFRARLIHHDPKSCRFSLSGWFLDSDGRNRAPAALEVAQERQAVEKNLPGTFSLSCKPGEHLTFAAVVASSPLRGSLHMLEDIFEKKAAVEVLICVCSIVGHVHHKK